MLSLDIFPKTPLSSFSQDVGLPRLDPFVGVEDGNFVDIVVTVVECESVVVMVGELVIMVVMVGCGCAVRGVDGKLEGRVGLSVGDLVDCKGPLELCLSLRPVNLLGGVDGAFELKGMSFTVVSSVGCIVSSWVGLSVGTRVGTSVGG